MSNVGFRGVDIRQSGGELVFRVSLKDSGGAKVTTGTTTLRVYELQSDGTIKSYDFSDNTFKATALTTATLAMTHRQGNNSTYDTGLWTAALSILTGFTRGGMYVVQVGNTGAVPPEQEREFVYGTPEGDLFADASGRTDVGYVAGTAAFSKDGTLAGATSTTVTLPASDAAGNAIPDDGRYRWTEIQIVAGTGVGQKVVLTTPTGTARQYNVLANSMPVTPSTDSDYVLLGSVVSNLKAINDVTGSAANLERSASVIYRGTITGSSPTTTTLVDTGLSSAQANNYKGRIVIFTSGNLLNQATDVTAFNAGTQTLTFTALSATPAQSDTFVIV